MKHGTNPFILLSVHLLPVGALTETELGTTRNPKQTPDTNRTAPGGRTDANAQ